MSSSQDKILSSRHCGIADCLQWLATLGADMATTTTSASSWVQHLQDTVAFLPDAHHDKAGLGVFLKLDVKEGDVLFSIPISAGLTVQHKQFSASSSPALHDFLQQCDKRLAALIARQASTVSPHDRYARLQGRVFLKSYFSLTFCVTLMLLFKDHDDDDDNVESVSLLFATANATSSALPQQAKQAYQFWSSFFDTLTPDWSHLPFLWTAQELEPLRGTSFHALACRMQAEQAQVFDEVFLPTLLQMTLGGNNNVDVDPKQVSLVQSKFQQALALVISHPHSKSAMDTARLGSNNNNTNNETFVEPIPVILPIIDLANGMRDTVDCNADLVEYPLLGCYQVVATRNCSAGEEVVMNYGENSMSNLDCFVKFGYIPLRDGQPVLIKNDFVTLPLSPSLRPACEQDFAINNSKNSNKKKQQQQQQISKLDQLRWIELSKNDLGKDRLVEPVPYFQRPLYLNGDLDGVVQSLRTGKDDDNIPQLDRLERFVMTMLASKQALKKLSEGKMPPPPVLQPWEPGQKMIQILDEYLQQHTTLSQSTTEQEIAACKSQTGNAQLATHARMVEREIVLTWRHAIAVRHGLYSTDAAHVERLPKRGDQDGGPKNPVCCVQCRTSLRVAPCPHCRSVYYCSEACRNYDWAQGHGRICAIFASRLNASSSS